MLRRQPVIGHNTDHSAADKAVIIILSLLTDKQACLEGDTEEKPLTLGKSGKKTKKKKTNPFSHFYIQKQTLFLPSELLAFDKRVCALVFPPESNTSFPH